MQELVIPAYEKNSEISLKSVKLIKDGGNGYALDITWTIETPEKIQELNIPRVWLPITTDPIKIVYGERFWFTDIGFGMMRVGFDDENVIYRVKTIKEKAKEMTLSDIERKLGHKVILIDKEK